MRWTCTYSADAEHAGKPAYIKDTDGNAVVLAFDDGACVEVDIDEVTTLTIIDLDFTLTEGRLY